VWNGLIVPQASAEAAPALTNTSGLPLDDLTAKYFFHSEAAHSDAIHSF